MNYIKSSAVGLLILASLFLMACQSNNSDAPPSQLSSNSYTLSIVDANRTITAANQTEIFNLYIVDSKTNSPVSDESISLSFFDGSLGTVASFSATTDETGRAVFNYTAPDSLVDLNGTVLSFKMDSNSLETVSSVLTINTTATQAPIIRMDTNSITVSQDGEERSVKVLAFDSNNNVFDGGTITVSYPSEIVNGSVNGGRFTQNEVEIINGEAVFSFIAPDPLVSMSPLDFVFSYNAETKTALTVNYVPEIPSLVLESSTINITKNGEIATINIDVYDKDEAPYSDGNIKIRYPSEVLSGKNVGSFNTSTANIVDGKASFVYTAPNPLNGNDSIIFSFYHDSQPELTAADLNISIVPDVGQIILTNYTLEARYETSMDLETTKSMSFFIQDEDANRVDDLNVILMRVKSLNPSLGTLEDSNGNTGSSLTLRNKNNIQLNITSNTISGVVPIEVHAEFKDANGDTKSLTKVFNVVVRSGPPTAMSLSYASTDQNETTAKFVENWVLTVTDKYNNLVNSNPSISMGALVGYAKSSVATSNFADYLYYNSFNGSGTLKDSNPDTFTAGVNAFENVDLVNDRLVLFGGSGYKFDAFGKWDINRVATSNTLVLSDNYTGSDVTDLGFAVGHNFRNEVCSGNPVVANAYPKDGDNILGSNGSMIVQIEYDYYLIGKDIVLWANLVGSSNNKDVRIGLGRKVTLRGLGIDDIEFNFAAGQTGIRRFFLSITDTVEWYRNANFNWSKFEVSGDGNAASVSSTSMDNGIDSCDSNDGIAYIEVNITSAAGAGTVSISGILPSREF